MITDLNKIINPLIKSLEQRKKELNKLKSQMSSEDLKMFSTFETELNEKSQKKDFKGMIETINKFKTTTEHDNSK